MDKEKMAKFLDENLVTKQEAMKITGQSLTAFNQSISSKQLTPFLERGEGTGKVRLYLRSDVEKYSKSVKGRRSRLRKK